MTIKTVLQTTEQYGTAAERSAIRTTDIAEGHRIVFKETDTGDVYTIDGGDSSWVKKTTNGAAHVSVENDVRGNEYPHDRILNMSYTLATTAVSTTPDLTGYCWGMVFISGLTAGDTVQIEQIIDGTNNVGDLLVRDNAGTLSAAATLANGTYYFALACRNLAINKTADAGADATVRFAFKSVGAPL